MHKILAVITFFFLSPNADHDHVSVKMNKRVNQDGVTSTINAQIYYSAEGNMVTKYLSPKDILVFNNNKGEVTMYDAAENTVLQSINFTFSTENSNFFYFLNNEKKDMGLEKMGFLLKESDMEDDVLVSTWRAPMEMSKHFSNVKLVQQTEVPIYMDYTDAKGKVIKKIYFSDYQKIAGKAFPASVTEINYLKKDSIVAKTVFSDFQENTSAGYELFNFEIPKNAKLIKK
jgi:outer membrane lipoprotein-sorting protein